MGPLSARSQERSLDCDPLGFSGPTFHSPLPLCTGRLGLQACLALRGPQGGPPGEVGGAGGWGCSTPSPSPQDQLRRLFPPEPAPEASWGSSDCPPLSLPQDGNTLRFSLPPVLLPLLGFLVTWLECTFCFPSGPDCAARHQISVMLGYIRRIPCLPTITPQSPQ